LTPDAARCSFTSVKEILKYSGCFVCGEDNECGLKAKFYFDDGRAVTECIAERRYEGYFNIYHGGITATLLDEVMIKALLAKDIYAMTVELTVKYRKLVKTGQKLTFEGRLERQKGRLYLTTGEARIESGEVVASAAGKYIEVKPDLKSELMKSLES
jgi:acyl-coenzyme A thioesterase PaaI-like protein